MRNAALCPSRALGVGPAIRLNNPPGGLQPPDPEGQWPGAFPPHTSPWVCHESLSRLRSPRILPAAWLRAPAGLSPASCHCGGLPGPPNRDLSQVLCSSSKYPVPSHLWAFAQTTASSPDPTTACPAPPPSGTARAFQGAQDQPASAPCPELLSSLQGSSWQHLVQGDFPALPELLGAHS